MKNIKQILLFIPFVCFVNIFCQVNKDTLFIKNVKDQKIYIEKNKSSDYYKYISEFKDFNPIVSEKRINQFGLNSHWIKIYKYNSKYFLYAPCDWMYDTKIVLEDKKIQIRNAETIDFAVKSIKRIHDDVIIRYKSPHNYKKSILKIHPINGNLGIYEFIIYDGVENYKYLMVSANNYLNFDIIVNDCIDSKVEEFEFDK